MQSGYSIISEGELKYISFDIFKKTGLVSHAFTTRLGGVSRGEYRSLNLAMHTGDDNRAVLENRKRICLALGAGIDDMVAGDQVHGINVHIVAEADRGRGSRESSGAVPATDALITDRPGILLSSYYADCVPVMIIDPVRRAIGLAHAGWKGTVRRIAATSIRAMSDAFGTDPGDCLAVIAPSIGPCCYEIDRPVHLALTENGFDTGPLVKETAEGRWKLDLWRANEMALLEAGVSPHNINVAGLCTSCSQELFFSYRGQSGKCGRMASLMMLK